MGKVPSICFRRRVGGACLFSLQHSSLSGLWRRVSTTLKIVCPRGRGVCFNALLGSKFRRERLFSTHQTGNLSSRCSLDTLVCVCFPYSIRVEKVRLEIRLTGVVAILRVTPPSLRIVLTSTAEIKQLNSISKSFVAKT